ACISKPPSVGYSNEPPERRSHRSRRFASIRERAMRRQVTHFHAGQRRPASSPRRVSLSISESEGEIAAFAAPAFDFPKPGAARPPAPGGLQALRALQRTVGNAAVGEWVQGRVGTATAAPRRSVARGAVAGLAIQRDGPPTTDPSLETPKPADLADS